MIASTDARGHARSATGPGASGGPPWLLVSGDFTPLGGMDRANHGLARYLAGTLGAEVHLVTHRAWEDLARLPNLTVWRVPRPLGSHLLGMPLLDRAGRRRARDLAAAGARVVVNGGNCGWGDINWVHYVHTAWSPVEGGGPARRAKAAVARRYALATERARLPRARLVVANSDRTRADVIEHLGVPADRVHTVYYGSDPGQFRPPTEAERAGARARLGWADDRPVVAFVGALGDRRKGFDTLLEAWRGLAAGPSWDARLAVVGAGASLPAWRARAEAWGLAGSVQFLGFRGDVPAILAASDALVSPTRYEAYGLGVHEALCSGLPALVGASSGVAERYPAELRGLLLPDPDDPGDLAARLRAWRADPSGHREAVGPFGRSLRERTWDHCAAEIVALAGGDPGPAGPLEGRSA